MTRWLSRKGFCMGEPDWWRSACFLLGLYAELAAVMSGFRGL